MHLFVIITQPFKALTPFKNRINFIRVELFSKPYSSQVFLLAYENYCELQKPKKRFVEFDQARAHEGGVFKLPPRDVL